MRRLAALVGHGELEVDPPVGELALAAKRTAGALDAEAARERVPAVREPELLRQRELGLLDLRRAGLDLELEARPLRGGVGDRDLRLRLGAPSATSATAT